VRREAAVPIAGQRFGHTGEHAGGGPAQCPGEWLLAVQRPQIAPEACRIGPAQRGQLVVEAGQRGVRPQAEEVGRPSAVVGQREQQGLVEARARPLEFPQPRQMQREQPGMTPGPQRQHEFVERGHREADVGQVHAGQRIPDHVAGRYIHGPPGGGLR
jgi:hypothetical protein